MSASKPNSDSDINRAVRLLRSGGVIAHATEGVWGFACDPFDEQAVTRVLSLKGRSRDKGLIVAGAEASVFEPELMTLDAQVRRAVLASWPGAVTWILATDRFPKWITGGRETVACRVPGHDQARALAAAFGAPLVSTSANRAGAPEARTQQEACAFEGEIDFVLPGATLGRAGPSEIRHPDGERLR